MSRADEHADERGGERTWRWVVSGRVQGVWYRDFTRREARGLGLAGWVRNLPDGTVELAVRGPADKLAALRERLRQGPPAARVDAISEREPAGGTELPETFEVRY